LVSVTADLSYGAKYPPIGMADGIPAAFRASAPDLDDLRAVGGD
jgi:hypothetical protein